MTRFAFIPAKSRSTRLPNKNMLPLAGIPMLIRVIQTLKQTELFDEIWVSTESEETQQACLKEGAYIHQRPAELAQDRSTINDVCLHWLNQLTHKPDEFCCTYSTAVFLTKQDYIQAYSHLTQEHDGVMGVSEYNYPPVQALTFNDDRHLTLLMPEYEKVQSQYHPECFVSNGSQYWVKTPAYLNEQTFYLNKLVPYVTDETHILDINTQQDYEKAIARAAQLGW